MNFLLSVGIGTVCATIVILALHRWRPSRRWVYAGRVTLYGLVPGAFYLGRAIVSGNVREGLTGMLGAWLLLLPITFSIGAVVSAKRLGYPRPR